MMNKNIAILKRVVSDDGTNTSIYTVFIDDYFIWSHFCPKLSFDEIKNIEIERIYSRCYKGIDEIDIGEYVDWLELDDPYTNDYCLSLPASFVEKHNISQDDITITLGFACKIGDDYKDVDFTFNLGNPRDNHSFVR